jgi:hypothetical protein
MNMHHTKGRNVAHRRLIHSILATIYIAPGPHAPERWPQATTTTQPTSGLPERGRLREDWHAPAIRPSNIVEIARYNYANQF